LLAFLVQFEFYVALKIYLIIVQNMARNKKKGKWIFFLRVIQGVRIKGKYITTVKVCPVNVIMIDHAKKSALLHKFRLIGLIS